MHLKQGLRRSATVALPMDATDVIRLGNLTIDRSCYEVKVGGRRAVLSRLAFDLLFYLATHAEEVVPVPVLLEKVWGEPGSGSKTKVRVQVCKLRDALTGSDPWQVTTLAKRGYMLTAKGSRRLRWSGP